MNTATVSHTRETLSSGKKGATRPPSAATNKAPKEAVSHFGKLL